MAVPWNCISRVGLASGELVEDLKLGIDLASAGKAPVFCPQALVVSEFPTSMGATRSQRKRWEHGHLGLMLRIPGLLFRSLTSLNTGLLALALDLCVPPLALLLLLIAAVWSACALFYFSTALALPILLASFAAILFTSSVLLAWGRYGRRIVPMRGLAMALPYALGKLPLYAKFLFARQSDWVRSKRNDGVPPSES
jgi:cellulose synthase/poly-beta-1,6-N-acetylglucosamine synthase-like glycosyltransferase